MPLPDVLTPRPATDAMTDSRLAEIRETNRQEALLMSAILKSKIGWKFKAAPLQLATVAELLAEVDRLRAENARLRGYTLPMPVESPRMPQEPSPDHEWGNPPSDAANAQDAILDALARAVEEVAS